MSRAESEGAFKQTLKRKLTAEARDGDDGHVMDDNDELTFLELRPVKR